MLLSGTIIHSFAQCKWKSSLIYLTFHLPPQLVSQQDLCLDFFLISIFFPLSKLLAILCELVFLIYCYYSPYTIILFVFFFNYQFSLSKILVPCGEKSGLSLF